jgi:hypothetical protein
MINAFMERVTDGRGRSKIHISYPERNDISRAVFIPFHTGCAPAFNMRIKVKIKGVAHFSLHHKHF